MAVTREAATYSMMIWVPFPKYSSTAKALDSLTLSRQRHDTMQVLHTALGISKKWQHHPVTMMWRAYPYCLCEMGIALCKQANHRRIPDPTDMLGQFNEFIRYQKDRTLPWWDCLFMMHKTHRQALTWRFPTWYEKKFIRMRSTWRIPLVWPVARHEWSYHNGAFILQRSRQPKPIYTTTIIQDALETNNHIVIETTDTMGKAVRYALQTRPPRKRWNYRAAV